MSRISSLARVVRNKVRRRLISRLALEERRKIAYSRFAEATRLGEEPIYSHEPVDCAGLAFPECQKTHSSSQLKSGVCTKVQLESSAFRYWARRLNVDWSLHRKLWEHCFILQALYERGMLQEDRRGLGFAVGRESLPSLMAALGCRVLASDLLHTDRRAQAWAKTSQLATNLTNLHKPELCPGDVFHDRVRFRPIDMNSIPDDVQDFDFTWSSCSFEHCGSIDLGKRFILEQMKCLKPGGIAVHTTEYNLSSTNDTIESGPTVLFRRQDIEDMVSELRSEGHTVEPLWLDVGDSEEDWHVDLFPYSNDMHLKLEQFDKYVTTSIAIIVKKSEAVSQTERSPIAERSPSAA